MAQAAQPAPPLEINSVLPSHGRISARLVFWCGCRVAERGVNIGAEASVHKLKGTDIGGYVPASTGARYTRIFHVVEKGGEGGWGM